MDGPKFFQAWNNFLGLFQAASNASGDDADKHNDAGSSDDDSETHLLDEADKHSDAGSSYNGSETHLPDDTNPTEPGNGTRSNPTPRGNGGIAAAFNVYCRQAFNSVVVKVEMAVSQVKDYVSSAVSQVKDFISSAVHSIKEKGILGAAKELGNWIKSHPKETALIVVPLVAMAITAITLLAIGFGPAGVAAGSTAAVIQAGIGNVVAHSLFATCTSAMMGGYGAPIVFGGVWFLATAATAAATSAWKRWKSRNDRSLVLLPQVSPKDISKKIEDAAENLMIGCMLVAAYVTYRIKSWMQSRRRPKND